MEITQTEQNGFKFIRFWRFINSSLVEMSIRSSDICLQVLRSLIGHFNGSLQNTFRNNVHVGHGRRFRRNETSETFVTSFTDFFEVAFQTVQSDQPRLHKMHVLKHDPVTVTGGIEKSFFGSHFLTLSHRNIYESSILDGNILSGSDSFHIRSGVTTREKHKENRCVGIRLFVTFENIERLLLHIRFPHNLINKQSQCRQNSIRSQSPQQQ
jgi:hypothetical protein